MRACSEASKANESSGTAGTTGLLNLPDDVLWLVLRREVCAYFGFPIYEYRQGGIGYRKHGPLITFVLGLAHIHPKFYRCIHKRLVWHKTCGIDGWDFIKGSFTKSQTA